MKLIHKILVSSVVMVGLQLGMSSCVSEGYVGTGVYYGPQRDPWFHDDPWVDGHRWYGGSRGYDRGGVYLHPPRGRR